MDKLLASTQRQPTGLASAERVNAPPGQAGAPLTGANQSSPVGGNNLPDPKVSSANSVSASDPKVLVDSVQKVNDYAKAQHRAVRFAVDQDLGRPVVKVVDDTETVVRQIPSEVVIRLARNLEAYSKESEESQDSAENKVQTADQAFEAVVETGATQPDNNPDPGQVINTLA